MPLSFARRCAEPPWLGLHSPPPISATRWCAKPQVAGIRRGGVLVPCNRACSFFAALALARLRSPAVACGRLRSPAVACGRGHERAPKTGVSRVPDRVVLVRCTAGRLGEFGCAVSGGLRLVRFVNGVLPKSDGFASLLENFARGPGKRSVCCTGQICGCGGLRFCVTCHP